MNKYYIFFFFRDISQNLISRLHHVQITFKSRSNHVQITFKSRSRSSTVLQQSYSISCSKWVRCYVFVTISAAKLFNKRFKVGSFSERKCHDSWSCFRMIFFFHTFVAGSCSAEIQAGRHRSPASSSRRCRGTRECARGEVTNSVGLSLKM